MHFRLKDQIKRYWFFHSEFKHFNEGLIGWDTSLILYNFRYLLIFLNHIKKILKSRSKRDGMWSESRARQPTPRPSMCFPHKTSSRVPVWMLISGIRITLQRPIFKTTLGQSGFLCPTSRIFSQFIVKLRLDNKAVVRYLNLSRLYDNENCRWVSGPYRNRPHDIISAEYFNLLSVHSSLPSWMIVVA